MFSGEKYGETNVAETSLPWGWDLVFAAWQLLSVFAVELREGVCEFG
tara:strand:- start:841 stop:981 length:141 start_codon:yes stop_codon:yes gene_type:complete